MTSPSSSTIRLYITPLTPDTLPSVLPPSIRPLATEISFHHIPTFPENDYGYVTLPTMEADKIKKKLNGSILKGRKYKVEAARPKKRQRDEEDLDNTPSSPTSPSSKRPMKKKAEANLLEGFELPADRKVKRGWTESTNDKVERRKKEKKEKKEKEKSEGKTKSQQKSKYTEKTECLFRTNVPPNKPLSTSEKLGKQSKRTQKPSRESTVHEFSNTITQPSFLRSEDGKKPLTSTFEDGKGWRDECGELKEQASKRIRTEQYRPGQRTGHKEKSNLGKRSPKKLAPKISESRGIKPSKEIEAEDSTDDWTSSSGSSSSDDEATESDSESDSESESESEDPDSETREKEPKVSLSQPDGEVLNYAPPKSETSIKQADSAATNVQSQSQEVHPLEALFKKPTQVLSGEKPDSEAPAQFSFFGQGDIESEEEAPIISEPLTPFTKRDLQGRGLRSAAPTPDTAHVGRTINWNAAGNIDAATSEALPSLSSPVPKADGSMKDESDFTKWFWENRGDNNRAWKRRRREASKEQRKRENRRVGMKGKS